MNEELTLGQWIGTIVISCIPCVGLIFLLIWAFGSNTQIDKKRFAQAELIVAAVLIVLSLIAYAILGASLLAVFSSLGQIG